MINKDGQKSKFRFEIYSDLANRAKRHRINWVVLHGTEGYPERIGRDLDVFCESEEDKDALVNEFEICLRKNKTKWIIHPNPIWGIRVLGISEKFDVAELHILNKIRTFNISQNVDWSKVYYKNNIFPIDPVACFFKSCLMPALVNQLKWQEKCEDAVCPKNTPQYLYKVSRKLERKKRLSTIEKLLFFGWFHLLHPIRSTGNLCQWLILKNKIFYSPTVPVFSINKKDTSRIINLVEKNLCGIFLGTNCVDNFTSRNVKKKQALQMFLYTTTRTGYAPTIPVDGQQKDNDILHYLIDSFSHFTKS